jgi:hypothetical protein
MLPPPEIYRVSTPPPEVYKVEEFEKRKVLTPSQRVICPVHWALHHPPEADIFDATGPPDLTSPTVPADDAVERVDARSASSEPTTAFSLDAETCFMSELRTLMRKPNANGKYWTDDLEFVPTQGTRVKKSYLKAPILLASQNIARPPAWPRYSRTLLLLHSNPLGETHLNASRRRRKPRGVLPRTAQRPSRNGSQRAFPDYLQLLL